MTTDRDAHPHDRPGDGDGANRRPGIVRLYAGMTVAPLAWSLHVLFGYSLAAYACYPTTAALGRPVWPDLRSIVAIATGVSWLMLVAGCVIAWLNWRATREVSDAGPGHMLETGAGRPRFMALCGLLVSGMFALALCFTSAGVFLVPDCGP